MAEVIASHPTAVSGRSRLHFFGTILTVVLLAIGGLAWFSLRQQTELRYATASVDRGEISRGVTATGTINPELTIVVGSYVSGVIRQVFCDYNTQVRAGQICAKIDPRPYQMVVNQDKASLDVARAQLAKDRANLAYTRRSYERTTALARRNFSTQEAADATKSAYDQAQAQIGLDQATIEQRQAELDAAQVNLGYTDIVSPVDGVVVSRNVTQGQTVAASFQTPTLFLIATDLTKMQVDTNVSESDIGGIMQGNQATFSVDAFPGRVFAGIVSQVRQSPQTVQNVVTFDSVVSVANVDMDLKPGMTASARIVVEQKKDVLRVPNQALRYQPGAARADEQDHGAATRVWVLRNGAPVPVAIETGLADEAFTEVMKGDLEQGDRVILDEEASTGKPTTTLLGLGL
jgi:HlyD family secretion protein